VTFMAAIRAALLVLLLIIVVQTRAIAQSLDCSRAQTRVEHAICADSTLRALDASLANEFKHAIAQSPQWRQVLTESERYWLSARDQRCGSLHGDQFRGCLALAYLERTAFVRDQAAQALLAGRPSAGQQEAPDIRMTCDSIFSDQGIVLTSQRGWGYPLSTPCSFRPPVDITIVAKTESTNVRIRYAAQQIIFNWELDRDQLRVDGGPANGLHQPGAGAIPVGQYVTIHWLVTPTFQEVYVDGQLRFRHDGDYSQIDQPVSVYAAEGSTITVKSILVKPISTQPSDGSPAAHDGVGASSSFP